MKILLTGATGFLGSHVARLLLLHDCEVHILVRHGSDTWRINDILPQLHAEEYDFTGIHNLDAILSKIQPDICIHLAWHMGPGSLTDLENVDVLSSSLYLAVRLAALGCKKLLVAGTCFEYDAERGYVAEDSPIKPSNLYAASKQALHSVVEQLSKTTSMEVAWLRLFFLYGPHEGKHRLVPSVILSLLKDEVVKLTPGEQVRDFVHVEDAASAIWDVAVSPLTGAVNIGTGSPWTVRHAVNRVGEMMDRSDLLHFGALEHRINDPFFLCANNKRLLQETSWKPRFGLDEGLEQTIEWWRQHTAK